MNLGPNKIRYGVTKVDGNMRQVIGAKVGAGSPVYYTEPVVKLGIKNNGETNTLTLYSGTTLPKGSYIIKDESLNVYYWGWISGDVIEVPADTIVWTHEQSNANSGTARLASIPDGDFEIVEWSNCSGDILKQGFQNSTGLTKVPDTWPDSCTGLAYCLKNCTNLHDIPSWENLTSCKDVREAIAGLTINDLKIDTMLTGLINVTNAGKLLNNVKIDKDMLNDDEQFYRLYAVMKDKCNSHADVFGARSSGIPKYTVKYWYEDSEGNKEYVIPFNLLYVPSEWGGFEGDNVVAHVNRCVADACGLHYRSRYIRWDLSVYDSDSQKYYTVTNKVIRQFVEFYSSAFAIVENTGAGQSHCYIPSDDNAVTWFSDGSPIPVIGKFTAKVHLYLKNNPDATVTPFIVAGETTDTIDVGDYHEVFRADGTVFTIDYTIGINSTCNVEFAFDSLSNKVTWDINLPCGDDKSVNVNADVGTQTLNIYDASGQYLIYTYTGTDCEFIPENTLNPGTYLLNLTSVSSVDDSQSVVIESREFVVPEPPVEPIDITTATIEFNPYTPGDTEITWTTYAMVDGVKTAIDSYIQSSTDNGRYVYAMGSYTGFVKTNSFSLDGVEPGTYVFVVNARIGSDSSANFSLENVVIPESGEVWKEVDTEYGSNFNDYYALFIIRPKTDITFNMITIGYMNVGRIQQSDCIIAELTEDDIAGLKHDSEPWKSDGPQQTAVNKLEASSITNGLSISVSDNDIKMATGITNVYKEYYFDMSALTSSVLSAGKIYGIACRKVPWGVDEKGAYSFAVNPDGIPMQRDIEGVFSLNGQFGRYQGDIPYYTGINAYLKLTEV